MLDTNVVLSGALFGGVQGRILTTRRDGLLALVVSAEIMAEYERAGAELARSRPGVDMAPLMALIASHAESVAVHEPTARVCRDADDDKFLACALAGGVTVIVSGDKDLLSATGYEGIQVLTPRAFADAYLR